MEPSWTVRSKDGSEIAGYELGGSGEVLLIAHATGLCAAMYQLLADEVAGTCRVVALDFRGHGRSTAARPADYRWDRMAEDVVAVAERLHEDSGGRLHGFGHSMGGAALLLAERRAPSTFSSLYLFEPIIFPDDYPTSGQNEMAAAARRRRLTFDSRAEVHTRYATRPPFNEVLAGCLAAYVENGFAEEADGQVRLRCLPEVEAEVFEQGRDVRVTAIASLVTPVTVGVGHDEPGPNPARLGEPLAQALQNGTLLRYEHIGHFGPLRDPWTIGRDVVARIGAV